jgi:ferric-dicitrate binding protein FerR (iron transport regulator)
MVRFALRRMVIGCRLHVAHLSGRIVRCLPWNTGESGSRKRVDAVATAWFVRFHAEPLETFDWTGFDRWINSHRDHRDAYDGIEALWYALNHDASHAETLSDNDLGDSGLRTQDDPDASIISLTAHRASRSCGGG